VSSSVTVVEAKILAEYVYDKLFIENLRKIEDGNQRKFAYYMHFHLKNGLGVEFKALM